MGKCSVKLSTTNNPDDLAGDLGTYIKQIGGLADSMISAAAKEFFESTARWRYVSHKVELASGDQQIDLDMPDGLGVRVRAPIFQLYQRGSHDKCDEIKVYERKDGAQADLDNTDFYNCDKALAFYQPVNGKIIFSRPIEEDSTFRLELILWPLTFDAIECVPDEIMSTYREGIISFAIQKAMEIPDKPWTTPKEGYSPNLFASLHANKAAKHMKSAKNYHRTTTGEGRPFTDKFSSTISSNGRKDRGYGRHGYHRHRW